MQFTRCTDVRPEVAAFESYEPGLSIAEIAERYGLDRVIKMASNENALGVSPAVRQVLAVQSANAFRYPQAGNPRLVKALAEYYGIDPKRVVLGNGSDEIIDLLFRIRAVPGVHNAVAFRPCFGIYPTQARMAGVELRQTPLKDDFSFDFASLLDLVDENTTLVFVTTPDNPSGRIASLEDLGRSADPVCDGGVLLQFEAFDFPGRRFRRCKMPASLQSARIDLFGINFCGMLRHEPQQRGLDADLLLRHGTCHSRHDSFGR